MRHPSVFLLISLVTFSNCQHRLPQTYTWGFFNIKNGYDFISKIEGISSINQISIVDTKADGNEYVVNEQKIFIDTSHADMPNYYSYIKRAEELNIEKDSLFIVLKSFYKIGVNEFIRQEGFYQFPVVQSVFTTERGYLYTQNLTAKQGNRIQTKVGNHNYHLVLAKQLDKNWYEYYSTR